jgi:dehydrogenase/reductase SDR family member 4
VCPLSWVAAAGFNPIPNLGPYSVSKTALFGLTGVLARELAEQNIRVNCLAPGVIETRFSEPLWKNEAVASQLRGEIPLRRFGTPAEMAGACVSRWALPADACSSVPSAATAAFLVSDDASYLTGETLVAAGGMQARL